MTILEATYETIRIREQRGVLYLQLYRPEANNSINATLIREMKQVLLHLESVAAIKVVVLEGLPDSFCSGMDFQAISDGRADGMIDDDPQAYYALLQHFSRCSKVIIAKVEGKVNAGGIGLVAASDLVIADEKATFGLSEALFGLLPACVMPFLIRRIGYQKAQWMTLITQGIPALRAFQIGLADELTTDVNDAVRRNALRLNMLETDTIKDLKNYMDELWIMNDSTRQLAVGKLSALMKTERVQSNIKNFIQNGKLPWNR
ncbi:enoyl-CoA hydratase/isomerase [Chitinophaga nivalis]|uniref:Enoyl-CoA hydratase/isomerase n=1 Tax=Chitinophaga nivalis TaxID=2991709 RepID=A0ABT3IKC5_9BACT|nr:enoyl-CoA hydratase/isomerase [Chitinophaga nivalis]MCW3465906.1 enoyl-CoA hydratase/isomerase [Chitinophaga nivalis]MCW3484403.1 enoyl-CoA hydratase/isomerase [Chitinophaga nivalis]